MSTQQKTWRVSATAGSNGGKHITIFFYGGLSFHPNDYEEDKSPYEIAEILRAAGTIERITARLNSPGGNAFAGLAIGNLLRDWPAPVTTHVDGVAGSAATLIFAAGDERIMPPNTLLYVHNPENAVAGYASDLRKAADELDKVAAAIITTYRHATGLIESKLQALMDAETLLTAQDAYDLGFATSVNQTPVSASIAGNVLTMNGLAIDLKRHGITLTAKTRAAVLTPKSVNTASPARKEYESRRRVDAMVAYANGHRR